MAAAGDTSRYESSAGDLSSPPLGCLSEPGSPSRLAAGFQKIVVGTDQPQQPSAQSQQRQITFQQYQQPFPSVASGSASATSSRTQQQKRYELIDGQWVQLTAAGVPRKKPGRKLGSVVKAKASETAEQPKARKPRKPRDPNAPPVQRKRKLTPASDVDTDGDASRAPALAAHLTSAMPTSASSSSQPQHQPSSEHRYSPQIPKRDAYPGSMQNLLNADPPAPSSDNTTTSSAPPVRSSGLSYDPIRGNYDPVRETITSHGSSQHHPPTMGSPRGPAQLAHRSPSIASMLEPQAPAMTSPSQSHQGYRPRIHAHDSTPLPPSTSYRPTTTTSLPPRQVVQEARKDAPPPPPPVQRPVVNQANFTISNGLVRRAEKTHTGVSTPKTNNLDDVGQDSEARSILDFGKAKPSEELQAPTIVLNIPIKNGETNKYVNFMRMAEERYGWDALHPRLAANRDRKARIAAAASSLEKTESGRESGDEMSVDLSEGEGRNQENGGASGPDAQAKPKKRNFKEDQYDVNDDFVDDSELLWEAQAAASRDGFFVYSGPLVPEVEKPPAGHDGPPKRGRGSRGGRGGRGSTRGGGAGRGGGTGSRGGAVTRKPRITKSEKLQREREKAERENMAQLSKTPTNSYALQPTTPSFADSELGA